MQEDILSKIQRKKIIIFSSDCVGGRLMKDYCIPQMTPMVNIWYSAEDFLKMCERPDYYFSKGIDTVFMGGDNVPTGKIDDVTLHFGHDIDLDSPVRRWEKGCRHYFKAKEKEHVICVITNDRNGFTENMIQRFDNLPYRYKIIFTHKPYNSPNAFYMEGEDGLAYVNIMTDFENWFTTKRRYDRFDFYKWFIKMLSEEKAK